MPLAACDGAYCLVGELTDQLTGQLLVCCPLQRKKFSGLVVCAAGDLSRGFLEIQSSVILVTLFLF